MSYDIPGTCLPQSQAHMYGSLRVHPQLYTEQGHPHISCVQTILAGIKFPHSYQFAPVASNRIYKSEKERQWTDSKT